MIFHSQQMLPVATWCKCQYGSNKHVLTRKQAAAGNINSPQSAVIPWGEKLIIYIHCNKWSWQTVVLYWLVTILIRANPIIKKEKQDEWFWPSIYLDSLKILTNTHLAIKTLFLSLLSFHHEAEWYTFSSCTVLYVDFVAMVTLEQSKRRYVDA